MRLLLLLMTGSIGALISGTPAAASELACIKSYFASTGSSALGFSPSDVERIAGQVAASAGLSTAGIKLIPCEDVDDVQANYIDNSDVPTSDYVFFNKSWISKFIGPVIDEKNKRSYDESIFLFAHEFGHAVNRHFTSARELPRLEKELAADIFAGCAAGSLATEWENIQAFVSRMRPDTDTTYPSRKRSLIAVEESFNRCRARVKDAAATGVYEVTGSGPEFRPPMMNGRTLDGCMITPERPGGDECASNAANTIAANFCKHAGYLTSAGITTEYTPAFKASYKLTKAISDDGRFLYVWNEDDGGGYIIASTICRK